MENFYKRIRKRSDDKPVLMAVLVAVFYLCMGAGFTGIQYEETLTLIISCLLCVYMTTLVYAIVKGNKTKAAANCVIFFVIGALAKFVLAGDIVVFFDVAIALCVFIVFFGLGLALGKIWYGKYME